MKYLLILVAILIIGSVGYIFGLNTNKNISITTTLNGLTAVSTGIIAFFTFYLFYETNRLRKDQAKQIENLEKELIRPKLELYLSLSTDYLPYGKNSIYIHLENKGNGIAKNIKFQFLNNLPDTQKYIVDKLKIKSIFEQGVTFLNTNKPVKNSLIKMEDLLSTDTIDKEKLLNCLIGLNMTYLDVANNQYKSEALLNFSELKEFEENNQLEEISNALTSIDRTLQDGRDINGDISVNIKNQKS